MARRGAFEAAVFLAAASCLFPPVSAFVPGAPLLQPLARGSAVLRLARRGTLLQLTSATVVPLVSARDAGPRGRQLAVCRSSLSGAFASTDDESSSTRNVEASPPKAHRGVLNRILRVVSFGLWGGEADRQPSSGGSPRSSRGGAGGKSLDDVRSALAASKAGTVAGLANPRKKLYATRTKAAASAAVTSADSGGGGERGRANVPSNVPGSRTIAGAADTPRGKPVIVTADIVTRPRNSQPGGAATDGGPAGMAANAGRGPRDGNEVVEPRRFRDSDRTLDGVRGKERSEPPVGGFAGDDLLDAVTALPAESGGFDDNGRTRKLRPSPKAGGAPAPLKKEKKSTEKLAESKDIEMLNKMFGL